MLIQINRILNNKYFLYFIITLLIIFFLLFQLLNKHIKQEINTLIQYPLIIIPIILTIIFISNFNIYLSIILLLFILLIIISLKFNINNIIINKNTNESFETRYEENQREKDENTQDYVNGIKNLITGNLKNINNYHNNELNKGIQENKKKMLEHEQNKNDKANTINKDINADVDNKIIKKRIFNPNKEDDTNLMITKEILIDMINRIEYNYENNTYLKKYIKARIEELIETNNLLDEDL